MNEEQTLRELDDVRAVMAGSLRQTVLGHMIDDQRRMLGTGKMLRARLVLKVGPISNVPRDTLLHCAAAVEMIHSASLLHDDVIDGGYLRRNVPTFWVEKGIPGAILVGDLILFKAIDLVCRVENGRLVQRLVQLTGEVCDAESEQELLLRGQPARWDNCVSIARRKTGALFAFAAYACGGSDPVLSETMLEAGYAIGTAYQLADDLLDVSGQDALSGKTLGTDQARAKTTAVTANSNGQMDPVAYVDSLCQQADAALEPWPKIRQGWQAFMAADMRPALAKHMAMAAK